MWHHSEYQSYFRQKTEHVKCVFMSSHMIIRSYWLLPTLYSKRNSHNDKSAVSSLLGSDYVITDCVMGYVNAVLHMPYAMPTLATVIGFCLVACKHGLLLREWTLRKQLILLHAIWLNFSQSYGLHFSSSYDSVAIITTRKSSVVVFFHLSVCL